MKNRIIKSLICATLLALAGAGIVYAVTGETLMNVQNPTVGGTTIAPIRITDAGKLTADAQTSGLMSSGLLLYNGTNWDRVRGDSTNGLFVNVKASSTLTVTGNQTPADGFANPTNAINSYSLLGIFDGSNWQRAGSAGGVASGTTGGRLQAIGIYATPNGTNWDRVSSSNAISGALLVDSSSTSVSRIITNTTTTVKSTTGRVNRLIVNTAGTTSTATFYDIAGAGCTGTPGSGFVAILQTVTAGASTDLNHSFTNGICVVTAGGATADISVLYR